MYMRASVRAALLWCGGSTLFVGCSFGPTEPGVPCRAAFRELIGTLEVVIRPPIGFFGHGSMVFVGDVLDLDAAVQPIVGGSMDLGSGACLPHYGAPRADLFEWTSSDPELASVDDEGRVLGRSLGTVRITARATAHGLEGHRDIAVRRPGG